MTGASGRTILVTGGAGFIGSALVRRLIRETGHRVVNVDRLTYASSPEALESVEGEEGYDFVRADVRDGETVGAVLAEHAPEAVVHLAAASHVDRSIEDPPEFLDTNVRGTVALLEAATGHWRSLSGDARDRFRFLHVSTDEVYGDLGDRGASASEPGAAARFTEETPYAPSSPYAASKAAADHFVRAWRRTYGLPTLLVHACNNYGPWQHPEKLIPHVILRALDGRELPVYGDGGHVREWIHVRDHARGLVRVLEAGRIGGAYHLGSGEERTNLSVVRAVCGHLDELAPRDDGAAHADRIAFVEDRPGHDRRYALDSSRAREELGWRPETGFEEGLRSTVAWYLEHREWLERRVARGYRAERIGRSG